MRRRTRRRIVVLVLAGAVGLSSPVWAPPLLARMDAFQVETVGVTGVRYIPPDEIVRRADVAPDASVWDDPSGWEARVRDHPLVRDARVVRTGMHRLEIRVKEVEPVALAATPELVPVDREGRRLPLDPAEVGLDLPILGGEAEMRDGRLAEGETRRLLDTLVRLQVAEPGFVEQASEFRTLADGGVAVWMTADAAGARKILLPASDPVRALGRVQVALGAHGGRPVAAADARFDGQVVLKLGEVDA